MVHSKPTPTLGAMPRLRFGSLQSNLFRDVAAGSKGLAIMIKRALVVLAVAAGLVLLGGPARLTACLRTRHLDPGIT